MGISKRPDSAEYGRTELISPAKATGLREESNRKILPIVNTTLYPTPTAQPAVQSPEVQTFADVVKFVSTPASKGASLARGSCGEEFDGQHNLTAHIRSHRHPRFIREANDCGKSFIGVDKFRRQCQ
jgi:hypothetical protein